MQTEKGPGRCLSVRERKGHSGTPLRSLSTYILGIAFRKKTRKKTNWKSEKERATVGHLYTVYLLSSCVLNWEKCMKKRFLQKPCDWIWKQKNDKQIFKRYSPQITLGNKTNRKNLQKGAIISDHYYFCLSTIYTLRTAIPHICHFFYTGRIFENQIWPPKKRLKAPKTLKMSNKSKICIFYSIWKNLHLTENFYTGTACGAL